MVLLRFAVLDTKIYNTYLRARAMGSKDSSSQSSQVDKTTLVRIFVLLQPL